MKKMIIVGTLCSAALGFAAAANAEIYTYDTSKFLDGSTDALVLGPTGTSTPGVGYINSGLDMYLDPLGYQGTAASTVALTTPNSFQFVQSVQQGESILVNEILADYKAGEMGCDAAGVCSDPLTVFTYSQSSLVASLAQDQLDKAGVPTDALRFVMLGANPSVVPTDLYPTEVFNIDGDIFADKLGGEASNWLDLLLGGAGWQDALNGFLTHSAYLGLTDDEINSATSVVDGMTTFNEIPALTTSELWQALLHVWFNVY